MAQSIDKALFERLREIENLARLPIYPASLVLDQADAAGGGQGALDAAQYTLDHISASNECMFILLLVFRLCSCVVLCYVMFHHRSAHACKLEYEYNNILYFFVVLYCVCCSHFSHYVCSSLWYLVLTLNQDYSWIGIVGTNGVVLVSSPFGVLVGRNLSATTMFASALV